MPAIVPLVEGQSEVAAVPPLIRRVLAAHGTFGVSVARPLRFKRDQIVRAGELERRLELARRRPGAAAALVLLDADDACPAELGPRLRERAAEATDLVVSVAVANREIEAWLLADLVSLTGTRGIDRGAVQRREPETPRGAKEALAQAMTGARGYVATADLPALLDRLDLDAASARAPSLARFVREVRRIGVEVAGP